MKVNRRVFLTTSAMAALAAVTPALAATTSTPTLSLWEAKVDTVLQMAHDYGFSFAENQTLFGFMPSKTQNATQLRQVLYQQYSRAPLVHDRVENLLTVHTWLRAKCGSCTTTQLQELNLAQIIVPHAYSLKHVSLGELVRSGEHANITYAAVWCRGISFPSPVVYSTF